ncbi:hypothetical protein B0H14DRAFT_2613367, partial [Mycena olivaceomarginata]
MNRSGAKRKKPTTYHFGLPQTPDPTYSSSSIADSSSTPDPTASAPTFLAGPGPSTTRVFREKTRIRQDGRVSQLRTVVDVALPPRDRPNRTHPDLPKNRPIYDWYSGGDVDVDRVDEGEGEEEESGCALRSSDRPLQQWAEDHLITYLEEVLRLEGRGAHAYLACRLCGAGMPDHRCRHCLNGGELICRGCIVAAHAKLPFHIIE